MADVSANLKDWSGTAASNSPSGSTVIGTGLDDNLRQIQATVRQDLASVGADITAAATTDLGAIPGLFHTITGNTGITSFGTVASGIWKILTFSGTPTITHNGTSLICPNAANITIVAGDSHLVESLGSGNWKVHGQWNNTRSTGTNTGDEPDASTTVAGIVELATDAETITGTDTARAITPANLMAVMTPFLAILVDGTPTIGSGFGTNPSIVHNNGSLAFVVNVGTGASASSGVITMPAAPNGWICLISWANNTSVITYQNGSTTTSITLASQGTSWASGQAINCIAIPY